MQIAVCRWGQANCGMEDLLQNEATADRKLDRHGVLMWGNLKPPTRAHEQTFALDNLREHFEDDTTRLTQNATENCDSQVFPLVVVADARATLIPDLLRGQLRKCTAYGTRPPESDVISVNVRHFNYAASLKFGRQHFTRVPAFGFNLDRDPDDPNT